MLVNIYLVVHFIMYSIVSNMSPVLSDGFVLRYKGGGNKKTEQAISMCLLHSVDVS